MRQKKTIIALVPSNLDLSRIEHKHQLILSKVMKDKIYVLLDSITHSRLKKTTSINPYTLLSAKKLKELYGDCYKEILNLLIQVDVIECDNSYIIGRKSKGYRYTKEYKDAIPVIKKITNSTLVKKFIKNNTTSLNNYEHLHQFIYDIEIDVEAAESYIYNLYQTKLNDYKIQVDLFFERQMQDNSKFDQNNVPVNPICWFYHQLRAIYLIHNKQIRFKVDETGYRLHTNLTNIKKELRNFITYKGNKLVAVDYSNSQPLLTTILLKQEYWSKKGSNNVLLTYRNVKYKDKEANFIYDIINNIKSYSSNTYTMFPTFNQSIDTQSTRRYISLCEKGDLYEYLERNLNFSKRSRKEVKISVFQILFTDNRYIGQKDAKPKREFKILFPEVYKVLAMIKKNKSNLLPILLQRIESEIILNRVAKRIERERPELPIFTIHDSVVTTVGNELYIQCVMKDEMDKAINLRPNTEIEYWNSNEVSLHDNSNNAVA